MNNRSIRYSVGTSAAPATLTNAYSGNVGSAVLIDNAKQLFIDIDYTMGAAETTNSVEVLVEVADPDNTNRQLTPATTDWRSLVTETTSGGTVTIVPRAYSFAAVSAAATYDRFSIDLNETKDVRHQWIRVSVKETGVAANAGSVRAKIVVVEEIE